MKNLLAIVSLILLFTGSISCNQTQKKTDQSISQESDTIQKKSSTNFIEVSETSLSYKGKYSYFFSVSVENFDENRENVWEDIQEEAMAKPYDNYTVVFFFNTKEHTPVFVKNCDFDQKYDKHCIAAFWHYPDGSIQFKQYPME